MQEIKLQNGDTEIVSRTPPVARPATAMGKAMMAKYNAQLQQEYEERRAQYRLDNPVVEYDTGKDKRPAE